MAKDEEVSGRPPVNMPSKTNLEDIEDTKFALNDIGASIMKNTRIIEQLIKISKKSVVMGNLIIKRDKQTADFKPLESEISDDKGVKFRGRSDNVIECNPA